MGKRKTEKAKGVQPKKDPELQAIYDRIRREFTAADLQEYTEIEEGIPLQKVLAELEELHRRLSAKKGARCQPKPPRRRTVLRKRKTEQPKKSPRNRDKTLQAIYDRIRREFSASDLQRYMMTEPLVPAEQVLAELEEHGSSTPVREKGKRVVRLPEPHRGKHEVHFSAVIAKTLRRLHRQGTQQGRGEAVLAVYREMVQRLKQEPTSLGESLYRLPALRMQVRSAIIRPIAVHFAVCEDRPLVFIKGAELLSE